jgi:hypothetical protein
MADYDNSFMESLRLSVINAADGSTTKFICLKKDGTNLLTCNDETVDLNRAFDDILTTNLDIFNPNNTRTVSDQQVNYLTTNDDEDNSENMYTSNQAWILLIEKIIDSYNKYKTDFTALVDGTVFDEKSVSNITAKLIGNVNDESESENFDEEKKAKLIKQLQTQSDNQPEFQEKIKGKINEIWNYNKIYIGDKIRKYKENIDEMYNKFTEEEITRLENFLSSIDNFFNFSHEYELIEIVSPTLIILKFLGSTNEKMLVDIVDNTTEYQKVNDCLEQLKSKAANGGGKRKKKSRKKNKRSKSKRRKYKKKKYSKRKSKNSNKKNIQKGGEPLTGLAILGIVVLCVAVVAFLYCGTMKDD